MKILITIYFLFILFNISSAQDSLSIIPAEGFPKWLKTAEGSTDQTSGIAFIRSDERGTHFLLADDTGTLHHLIINSDSLLTLRKIILSREVQQYISPFPKKDFEEILYDRHTGKVFLSIEGNYPSVKQVAGLYQIKFKNNDVLSDTVISIEKIKIQPEEKFLQYVDNNVCFEGLAADENYIYAALEG
ncbi:MAG: hypothetical protein EHM47_18320, partial [Ignavibacteriales bacterium]